MSLEGTTSRQLPSGQHSWPRALNDVLAHHAGPAMMAGGLLWVATYVVEILIGVLLGEQTYASPDASSS